MLVRQYAVADLFDFWTQAAQQGYKPKTIVVGRATLFPSAVEALGPLAKYLSIEIWWSPAHPFKSSLTGQSSRQVCDGTKRSPRSNGRR